MIETSPENVTPFGMTSANEHLNVPDPKSGPDVAPLTGSFVATVPKVNTIPSPEAPSKIFRLLSLFTILVL